jgi:bifunctional DNA-binding transcriptional regulator/antitoxin component of YhaV-PrlF toxin-antitoxin module
MLEQGPLNPDAAVQSRGRFRERDEEAVACMIDLLPTVHREQSAECLVMPSHEIGPGPETLERSMRRVKLEPAVSAGRENRRAGNPDILIFGMTTTTIQIRGRGTLTLPASLREKYRLGDGDPLTVVDLDGAVLLSPRLLVVPRLAAEMERLRRARKLSLKDLGGPARED